MLHPIFPSFLQLAALEVLSVYSRAFSWSHFPNSVLSPASQSKYLMTTASSGKGLHGCSVLSVSFWTLLLLDSLAISQGLLLLLNASKLLDKTAAEVQCGRMYSNAREANSLQVFMALLGSPEPPPAEQPQLSGLNPSLLSVTVFHASQILAYTVV